MGEYIPSVLCGWVRGFSWCIVYYFVTIPVVWDVSIINWIRGLVSPVLCSGMRWPLW